MQDLHEVKCYFSGSLSLNTVPFTVLLLFLMMLMLLLLFSLSLIYEKLFIFEVLLAHEGMSILRKQGIFRHILQFLSRDRNKIYALPKKMVLLFSSILTKVIIKVNEFTTEEGGRKVIAVHLMKIPGWKCLNEKKNIAAGVNKSVLYSLQL